MSQQLENHNRQYEQSKIKSNIEKLEEYNR